MKSFEESIAPIIQGAKDQGFMAGQQSKQAEVDELRKRIDDALVKISNHYHSCVARKKLKRMSASISEISEIEVHELNMRALRNILKGESHE